MTMIIFYLRLFCAWLWFMISFFVGNILMLFNWGNPSITRVIGQILYAGVRFFIGFESVIENNERILAAQPCVYIANHQDNLDILTLSKLFPANTILIAKRELLWVPIFGTYFLGSGNIFINRSNLKNSIAGLEAAAAEVKKRGVSVWIFPEGTRNHGSPEMLPFKKGAFRLAIAAGVPIVPIVQQHLSTYYDPKKYKLGCAQIKTKVLDPIETKGLTTADIDALMQRARASMEKVAATF